jgi:catechol 2,3-dioxygenase-like lactoylglutathione lyase family enzyme
MSLTADTFAVKEGSLAPFAPFVTDYRPYIELSVSSLERSVSFYSALFNVPPVERRAKSARFEITNPHLRLELHEDPEAVARDGHLGVQLKYNDDAAPEPGRCSEWRSRSHIGYRATSWSSVSPAATQPGQSSRRCGDWSGLRQ